MCQRQKHKIVNHLKIQLIPSQIRLDTDNVNYVRCGDQFTHSFLTCGTAGVCRSEENKTPSKCFITRPRDDQVLAASHAMAVSINMFQCEIEDPYFIHYTQVCDHQQQCPDNSDESFCEFNLCPFTSFECRSGECVPLSSYLDDKNDCYDMSDEMVNTRHLQGQLYLTMRPPSKITFNGIGSFKVERLHNTSECPITHFLCPTKLCLPVYLICNGVNDCKGGVDELDCDTYTCPGYYRCYRSQVCLHPDHVCDAIKQCPEQDDEMLCDLKCPDQCLCQGLAFVCHSPFNLFLYPTLRYLDARRSGIELYHLSNHSFIIYLDFSYNNITQIDIQRVPNLRFLDLRWNFIGCIDQLTMSLLGNLKFLILVGNPIINLKSCHSSRPSMQSLTSLDLSFTTITNIVDHDFLCFPNLKTVNLSHGLLTSISSLAFRNSSLRAIDLRNTKLDHIETGILSNIRGLQNVYGSTYHLCCPSMLPVGFNLKYCQSNPDLIASCDNLFGSQMLSILFWLYEVTNGIFSTMALCVLHRKYKNDRRYLLMFHLFGVNLFMCVYMIIILITEHVHHGEFVQLDYAWRRSPWCSFAYFFLTL